MLWKIVTAAGALLIVWLVIVEHVTEMRTRARIRRHVGGPHGTSDRAIRREARRLRGTRC